MHGSKSTGPTSAKGKARISEAVAASWARWRAERGLPETWRYGKTWLSRRRRETAADWLAEHGGRAVSAYKNHLAGPRRPYHRPQRGAWASDGRSQLVGGNPGRALRNAGMSREVLAQLREQRSRGRLMARRGGAPAPVAPIPSGLSCGLMQRLAPGGHEPRGGDGRVDCAHAASEPCRDRT